MFDIVVRPATLDDLDNIVRIEQKTFGAESFSRGSLRRLLPRTIVVDYDGVIGFCTYFVYKKAVRIYNIAIHESFRGGGLGKRLMQEVEAIAKEANKERVILEVSTKNIDARRLYENSGYQIIDEMLGYYHDGGNAFKMQKKIVHSDEM